MKQYIDKDDLVAEINALLDDEFRCDSYDESTGFQNALTLIKKFIDTLEVKEEFKIGETQIYLMMVGNRLMMVNIGLTSVVRNMKFHQTSLKMEIM